MINNRLIQIRNPEGRVGPLDSIATLSIEQPSTWESTTNIHPEKTLSVLVRKTSYDVKAEKRQLEESFELLKCHLTINSSI